MEFSFNDIYVFQKSLYSLFEKSFFCELHNSVSIVVYAFILKGENNKSPQWYADVVVVYAFILKGENNHIFSIHS